MTAAPSPGPGLAPRRAALIAVGLVFLDLVLGQLATLPKLASWYAGLAKPAFTPPNAVFGPVWTLLYALMALAFWRILILPEQKGRKWAIGAFLAQLALNVLWSYAFFAAESPLLGLYDIIPQVVLVAATLTLFWRLDRLAGICLAPSLLWVSYAGLLNFAIWPPQRVSGDADEIDEFLKRPHMLLTNRCKRPAILRRRGIWGTHEEDPQWRRRDDDGNLSTHEVDCVGRHPDAGAACRG